MKGDDGHHLVTVRMPMPMETRRRKPGRDELNTPMSRCRVVRDCVAAAMEHADSEAMATVETRKFGKRLEVDE